MSPSSGPHRQARESYFHQLLAATADVEPPFAVVDLDAYDANAASLRSRALGKPIRVASKSVRCRELLGSALDRPGFSGVMAFTLPEALWLAQDHDDVLVAYPSVAGESLRTLAADPDLAARVTLMVDSVDHLDLIAERARPSPDHPVRLCLDLDASLRLAGGRVHLGARRSPLRTPADAVALAQEIDRRPGMRLVGLMAYEAQIAGVGDAPPGAPLQGLAVRAMQWASGKELARRRAETVAAVRAVSPLEFVNGGGTGSVDRTAPEPRVTEVAAGSGLYGPGLFDTYRSFRPRPAAFFALPVVRRPAPGVVTTLGGGWVASGVPGWDRLPTIAHPGRLRYTGAEGAGEVQTPLRGPAADRLGLADRVWFRHAKAGELAERVNVLYLVRGGRIVGEAPTYRGEGRAFL
ncbi:amino acid deaminase/aldolase [Spiractinospora alimapuensis]|uniref:amino acid deaminase/aldolase n=1 Tax=Spiractinospora alimapuensis TaxID=2820884 RepID=UPI001F3450A0|nr:amino acid deaminase/aldolase [Spiractinospora alimapuensis]QVQ53901.1 amino acid deaminase/aldolase [Spiractinospora alimapuensis]